MLQLTDDELIRLLHTEGDRMALETVETIAARGAAIVPRLAEIVSNRESWAADGDAGWAPVHAAFCLGAIGTPEAVPPLVASTRMADEVDGQWFIENMPAILAALGRKAAPELEALAADNSASRLAREIACSALREIAAREPEARESAVATLRRVAADAAAPLEVQAFAGVYLLDFACPEDRPLLDRLVAEQKSMDPGPVFDADSVAEAYSQGPDLEPRAGDWREFYTGEAQGDEYEHDHEYGDEHDHDCGPDCGHDHGPPPAPIVNAQAPPGRNDPCPCGSGKKYKKCCG